MRLHSRHHSWQQRAAAVHWVACRHALTHTLTAAYVLPVGLNLLQPASVRLTINADLLHFTPPQASLDTLTQQLSALDALVAAQLLLAQQQAAAAAAAEKEQGRHAEAEAAAAARQAEAEGEAARLREGVAEGQWALAAKERELGGARAEQYASQVRHRHLGRALGGV